MGFEDILRDLNSADDKAEAARAKAEAEDDQIIADHGESALRQIGQDLGNAIALLETSQVKSRPVITVAHTGGLQKPSDYKYSRLLGFGWYEAGIAVLDVAGGVVIDRAGGFANPGGSTMFRSGRSSKQFEDDRWRTKVFSRLGVSGETEAITVADDRSLAQIGEDILLPLSDSVWLSENEAWWRPRDINRYYERIKWHDENLRSVLYGVDRDARTFVGQYDLGYGRDGSPSLVMQSFDKFLANFLHSIGV